MCKGEEFIKFPTIERVSYKYSFLYEVVFMVHYGSAINDDIKTSLAEEFIKLGWAKRDEESDSLNALSKGQSTILLGMDSIMLSFYKDEYQGFDKCEPLFAIIEEQTHSLKLTDVIISKKNHFQIMHDDNCQNDEKVIYQLLSDDFNDFYNKHPEPIVHTKVADDTKAMIIRSLDTKDEFNILRFEIVFIKNKCALTLHDELSNLNNLMFSFWRWSVGDDIISMMEGKL